MKGERHYEKAEEIMESIYQLAEDDGKHVVSIVELCYGAAQHYIAYGCEKKYGRHFDTHAGMPRLLREMGEDDIAIAFEQIDTFRHGRWYGSKGNGRIVRECLKIIKQIKEWAIE